MLQPDQIEPLLAFLLQPNHKSGQARFSGTHALYYLGGMLQACIFEAAIWLT